MDSFEELIKRQKTTGEKIEGIIRNFKKDPESRKESASYFQERLRRLNSEWSTFEATDNQIRLLENLPLEHEYFIKDYYSAISDIAQKYIEIFEASMLKISEAAIRRQSIATPQQPSQQAVAEEKQVASNHASSANDSNKLLRRQSIMMASLERLLNDEFSEHDLPVAQKLWETIEGIHFQLYETYDNPVQQGYDIGRFISLESNIRKTIKATAPITTAQNSARETNLKSAAVPMPNISIPKFDGNQLKWNEFFDLFSSLVINQPMTKIQKIWYLKTHVVGEASTLIKHFSATGENFDAAWAMVVDRYNNKRLLVNKLVQELVDTPNNASTDNFKGLHDKTQECLLALQNLNINTTNWDPLLLHILLKRLDHSTRLRYEQSLRKPREVPTIHEFLDFLERHFQSMEAIGGKEKSASTKPKVCTSVTAKSQDDGSCSMCKNGKHPLFSCKKFLQLSPSARLQFVQKQKYCCNCLKPGHMSKNCSSRSCMKCNKRHNTLLHLEGTKQESSKESPANEPKGLSTATEEMTHSTQEAASLTTAKQTQSTSYVLLSTAMINVNANGRQVQCRAILDSGSQLNFITERLVKRLGISTKAASININGIGSTNTKVQRRVNIALQSRVNNFNTRLEAAVLPHIISPQPSQAFDSTTWSIPKNIELADPLFNQPNKIDVLLGAEFYHQLLSIGQIKLARGLPTLQNTVLGWVFGGKIGDAHLSTATCGICTDSNLENSIARLWELEDVKTAERNLSISEKHCEAHFEQNHTVDGNGRYIVRLPFCENPDALGESHGIAFNRFLSLERRLAKDPSIKQQYVQFMEEYEALGHMTPIDVNNIPNPKYFIPHHCVLKPESRTTKLRVVFDASAKTTSGLSLNDLMHIGPNVQSELFAILLRFRMPRFVFTTDVVKMYRQMLIHTDDRKFQLIIWRNDPSLPLKYYQLNTITYGTRAAPYLATKCLEKIARQNLMEYPYGAQFLLDNFYVDDGIGGADSLNTALAMQRELIHILRQHGLKLQKWSANHEQLLQNVTTETTEVNIDFNSDMSNDIKTLGLTWIPNCDKFCVKVCLGGTSRITKRTVSSDLARLFDPLGMLAPIVVTAKIFIQELWQLKLQWDEALPAELHTRWMTFRNDLESIHNMKISRHIHEGQAVQNLQIHAFADASERAYGAAIYIRSVDKNGIIRVRLLCAKSRVAPLKRQTLPRLELCAAVLCAQLTSRVTKDLQLGTTTTYLWTDSEIVISWINSQSSSYHTFVANRVSTIQELTIPEQWRHINSKENPADILSRGLSPRKFADCKLWLYGPLFLHGREDLWPQRREASDSVCENDPKMELRKVTAVPVTTSDMDASNIIYKINHRGSFDTLQRITAYVLRFIKRSKGQVQPSDINLTTHELEEALKVIIRTMQQADFENELLYLKRHHEVKKSSQLSNLSPFLDQNNVLRVGGRLKSATLPFDAKHQMLIPYNDPITTLLMQKTHRLNRHCGPQALLSHVRQRFWPLKGKTLARSIVQKCVQCSKARPTLMNQVMGNLPASRITPARPFITSGVDFCGPFWVHFKVRGKKPQKAYIAIFCCFATKAVHLELVSDLTTDAFIGSLKRFISRRGHCQDLYCDNATNFVGAKNQLSELSEAIYSSSANERINKECGRRGITFHFIPPRAPHFGGLWEAAVKSAKHLLVRSVSTESLTYEELDTVVIEIEGILNSRPLCPLSDSPNDLTALTPGHFLIGEPLNAQVDTNSTPARLSLSSRWKLVTHLKQEFWRRWSREYLCELQYRNKWKTQKVNLQPGDMVILKEENSAPLKWPLGRVVKVYPGDDGIIRVAEVKTANGNCKRPIDRLAPLPINKQDSEQISATAGVDIKEHHQTSLMSQNIETISDNKSCKPQKEGSEVPAKRRRTVMNHSLMTAIIALMLLPLVLGAKFKNTQFKNQLGIHFEGIGTTMMSPTEWQLLIYYDLEGFWTELAILSNGTKALNQLCEEIKQKGACMGLVKHFEHTEAELLTDSLLLSGRRHKRAAIDLVGNIAHSLFGVLDSKYAEEMAITISQVKENEAHLLKLLKNQTSIVDSTINIIKADQESVKAKFDHIDAQISEVYNRIVTNSEDQQQENLRHSFETLAIQLTIIAARLQRTQSAVLDVLTSAHHGIISPLILTPSQLQNEIDKIQFHLPQTLELPVRKTDALQLYKIMKVRGGLTKNTVIFSITLPLIETDRLDLFNLIAIPNWINNTRISINPCSTFLAISPRHNRYVAISNEEFKACNIIKDEMYLCSKSHIQYEEGSTVCACEIDLFHNKTLSKCPLIQPKDTVAWIPLQHQNQYLYSLPTSAPATIVCDEEIAQLVLEGAGLLSLEPECILKQNFVSIKGQRMISSSLKSSYTSLCKITEKVQGILVKPLLEEINTRQYISQIKNLTELQTALATPDMLELPNKIKVQNYHHTTIGYTSLLLIVCVLLYLKCKKQSRELPIPAPRNQLQTTDFTVHI